MSLEILDALKSSMFASVAVAIAIAMLANILTSRIIKPERRDEKAKEKLFKILNGHLSAGGEIDIEFLKYIKSSVEREFDTNIVVSHLLEDFLVDKLQSSSEIGGDKNKNIDELKSLIESESQIKPFDSLPSEERRLLKGLRDSIDNNVSPESTYYFIDELSTVLSIRNSEYEKSRQTNRWSVPLAVIGLLLTIVFGLMSIFNGPSEQEIVQKIATQIELSNSNKAIQPTVNASAD